MHILRAPGIHESRKPRVAGEDRESPYVRQRQAQRIRERYRSALADLYSVAMGNAIAYPDEGSVSPRISIEDGRAVPMIADTGIGIPSADQARLRAALSR